MENSQALLQGSSDMEKGAYLGAVASIAMADRHASSEELEHLSDLAEAAGLSAKQKEVVIGAATQMGDEDVLRCLDVLKTSDLRFSLITDLIAFAKSDNHFADEEKKSIQQMASYLGVNPEQFSALNEFTDKAQNSSSNTSNTANTFAGTGSAAEEEDFLSSLGLKDKFKNVGINSGMLKGLLGFAAPFILSKMNGGKSRNRGSWFGSGGLGSIFSKLNGGSGYQKSGGFLSRLFGGGRW